MSKSTFIKKKNHINYLLQYLKYFLLHSATNPAECHVRPYTSTVTPKLL